MYRKNRKTPYFSRSSRNPSFRIPQIFPLKITLTINYARSEAVENRQTSLSERQQARSFPVSPSQLTGTLVKIN
jgi:hypothetical protein